MTSPCIVLCSRVRVKCSACSALPSAIKQQRVRFAGSVSCFTSIAIDRARRSSPVVRSCQGLITSVSTASKRRHPLEVLPWLNFTPDIQQVQAERFSFRVCVCLSGIKLLFYHATNRDQVGFCRQVSTR